jgi:topoisomerase-4 subunit B
MARSKAYLFRGVEIRWTCAAELIRDQTPATATFHFPGGLADALAERTAGIETVTETFAGRVERVGEAGAVEWAVTWSPAGFGEADGFIQSYCNTVPTPEGGTHEAGFRAALMRGLKAYADLLGEKRASIVTAEDHSIIGGLGSAVAEVLGERRPTPVRRIGLRDVYGESAPNDYLLEAYGISTGHVAAAAREMIQEA